MVDLYNMSLISEADTFADQFIIFNMWSEGILFTGLILAFTVIVFAGTKYADQSTIASFIYSTFFGAIVSMLFWLFRYQGEPAVPTIVPILFIFALAASVAVKYMGGSISQTD